MIQVYILREDVCRVCPTLRGCSYLVGEHFFDVCVQRLASEPTVPPNIENKVSAAALISAWALRTHMAGVVGWGLNIPRLAD